MSWFWILDFTAGMLACNAALASQDIKLLGGASFCRWTHFPWCVEQMEQLGLGIMLDSYDALSQSATLCTHAWTRGRGWSPKDDPSNLA